MQVRVRRPREQPNATRSQYSLTHARTHSLTHSLTYYSLTLAQVVQSCPRLQKPSFVLCPVRSLFSSNSLQLSPSTTIPSNHNLKKRTTEGPRSPSPDSFPQSLRLLFPKVANLDFEARVPVPFSIFPSTYREAESHTQTATETKVHEEVEIKPATEAGREGQYSSVTVTAEQVPPRGEQRLSEEEVRITREEEHYHRPGVQEFKHEEEHFTIREEAQRAWFFCPLHNAQLQWPEQERRFVLPAWPELPGLR
ncbi:hypothetical protein FGRMN_9069 [Fusarium graminum]|nr:hypothetical protein FGRMN_9069 [Fusarium graminum]